MMQPVFPQSAPCVYPVRSKRRPGCQTLFLALIAASTSGCKEDVAYSEAAQRGADVFEAHCSVCHDMTESKQAPVLAGLVGRPAGAAAFDFSDAFRQVDLVWTEETLDSFLQNPRETVPDNQMAFYGLEDARERDDLIAYIVEFKAE